MLALPLPLPLLLLLLGRRRGGAAVLRAQRREFVAVDGRPCGGGGLHARRHTR